MLSDPKIAASARQSVAQCSICSYKILKLAVTEISIDIFTGPHSQVPWALHFHSEIRGSARNIVKMSLEISVTANFKILYEYEQIEH